MVTRDVSEGREIEFNVRLCTHRIGLVGHEVSETVKLCIAAIYTNTRNDGISFFKIPSLVVLTQRWARHVPERTRNIGVFCIETHFTEERFELDSTTEATVGPTKQAWYIFRCIWSGKLPELIFFGWASGSGGGRATTSSEATTNAETRQVQPRQAYKRKERSWLRSDTTGSVRGQLQIPARKVMPVCCVEGQRKRNAPVQVMPIYMYVLLRRSMAHVLGI